MWTKKNEWTDGNAAMMMNKMVSTSKQVIINNLQKWNDKMKYG